MVQPEGYTPNPGQIQVEINSSFARTYRYPPQETKLRGGKKATVPVFEGAPVSVTIEALHRGARQITVKVGPGKAHLLADRLTLHPDWPLDTKVIASALRAVIADQCGPRAFTAVDDLLSRAAPRLTTGPCADLPGMADPVASTIAAGRHRAATPGTTGHGQDLCHRARFCRWCGAERAWALPRTATRPSATC